METQERHLPHCVHWFPNRYPVVRDGHPVCRFNRNCKIRRFPSSSGKFPGGSGWKTPIISGLKYLRLKYSVFPGSTGKSASVFSGYPVPVETENRVPIPAGGSAVSPNHSSDWASAIVLKVTRYVRAKFVVPTINFRAWIFKLWKLLKFTLLSTIIVSARIVTLRAFRS